MLRRVALVRADLPEERIASIIRVNRISELGWLAVASNKIIVSYWRRAAAATEQQQ
jgi:hypothetical protein